MKPNDEMKSEPLRERRKNKCTHTHNEFGMLIFCANDDRIHTD